MKYSRFLVTWTIVGGLFAAAVALLRPERWFAAPTAAAIVEVRVVPRFAPTADSVRRDILSDAYLGAAWNRFHVPSTGEVADANDVATVDVAAARQAQIERWRGQLDVVVEPYFTDDQRQIRITCRGDAEISAAAELAQFLAVRYAGELSAIRWYEGAERLRTAQNQLSAAGAALLEVVRGEGNGSKSASRPRFGALIIPTAATEDDAPKLIAPNADDAPHVAQSVAKPAADTLADARLVAAQESLQIADAALRRELAEILEPKSAEFPVVATEVAGLHLAHGRDLWYVLAGAIGLIAAVVLELRSRAAIAPAVVAENEPTPAMPAPQPAGDSEPVVLRTVDDAVRAVNAPLVAVVRRQAG